jgi:hypothetical protein
MSLRRMAMCLMAGLMLAAPPVAGARPHGGGYFSSPSSYRVVKITYTSSAVYQDHDITSGQLAFLDSQSSTVSLGQGHQSTGLGGDLALPIKGVTTGTMTRYFTDGPSAGSVFGQCSYRLSIVRGDQLLLNFTRRAGRVKVTFIASTNHAGYCTSTTDAEGFNWYLPEKTYPLSAFGGNTIVLHNSGSHADYPQDSSNNDWHWSLTVTLHRVG